MVAVGGRLVRQRIRGARDPKGKLYATHRDFISILSKPTIIDVIHHRQKILIKINPYYSARIA
jgi:hypothetical protein